MLSKRLALPLITILVVACSAAPRAARTERAAADPPTTGRAAPAPARPEPMQPGALAKTLHPPPREAEPTPAEPRKPAVSASPRAVPTCRLDESDGAPGFYRDDAWPRGEVVLTFDDGPHPTATPRVLELLADRDMPATFFVVGRAIRSDTYQLLQRMRAEGHAIGVHSYNHDVKMALRNYGERTVRYIRAQHQLTRVLVQIALLAKSPSDFDQLYERVIDRAPGPHMGGGELRRRLPGAERRLRELLVERGREPAPIVLSRPPGGAPYLGSGQRDERRRYAEALSRAGLLNVMWHGGAGDTDPARRKDFGFLTGSLRTFSRRGGVILIHDYIRSDALASALTAMANDDGIRVVPIERALERKFGCSSAELFSALAARATEPPDERSAAVDG